MKRTEIEWMPIGSVKPYDRNPRRNDDAVDAVANSIAEFGFKNPIIVDSDLVIIAGHTRLKAAKKLGLKEVPVVIASDLTAEQARAFRLVDNRTAELADWDLDMLVEEIDATSSANINTNPRIEQAVITVDTDVAQFYKAFFDSLKPKNPWPIPWEPWEAERCPR